jgi:hypothetical protein
MPDVSRSRRTPLRFARLVVTTMVATAGAGCQQLPALRDPVGTLAGANGSAAKAVGTQGNAPGSAAESSATAANPPRPAADDVSLPPLPFPAPAPTSTATPGPKPAPTPLLDEALERAEALKAIDDDPEPVPGPPAAAVAGSQPQPQPLAPPAIVRPATTVATETTKTVALVAEPLKPAPASTPVLASTPAPVPVSPPAVAAGLSPAPRPIDPEKPPKVVPPQTLWDEGLERLRTLAREQGRKTDDASADWRLRTQWLDALTRWEQVGIASKNSLATPLLTAYTELTGEETPDPSARFLAIRTAVQALEDRAPLEIDEIRLCRRVNGFGNFEAVDPQTCRPGQTLIVYCEMSGMAYAKVDDTYRSRLRSQVAVYPQDGGEPAWKDELGTAEDRCRKRRRDYFVNYRITLPNDLAPGRYLLRVTQDDEIAGQSTSSEVPIVVTQ